MTAPITHETKNGKLTICVTMGVDSPPTVMATASYEHYRTGILYSADYAPADISQMHRVFIGMPEWFYRYVRDNTPTVCVSAVRAVANFEVAGTDCKFAIVIGKVAPTMSPDDIATLQQEGRVARRKSAALEVRLAALEVRLATLEASQARVAALEAAKKALETRVATLEAALPRISALESTTWCHTKDVSVLAMLAYPAAVRQLTLVEGGDAATRLSRMIIGFNVNTHARNITFENPESHERIRYLINAGVSPENIRVIRNGTQIPVLFDIIDKSARVGISSPAGIEAIDEATGLVDELHASFYDVTVMTHNGMNLIQHVRGMPHARQCRHQPLLNEARARLIAALVAAGLTDVPIGSVMPNGTTAI